MFVDEIHLKHMDIYVKVIRKNIGHTYLKIKRHSGEVQVVVPNNLPDEEVKKFVEEKEPWILTHINDNKKLKPLPRLDFKNGERILIFGREVKLQINYIKTNPLYVEEIQDRLVVNIKKDTGKERIKSLVKEWYREKLEGEMEVLIPKWEEKMKIKLRDARTKQMKTRWGTCNITKKVIWINLELAKLPKKYLEYVIVHEMVHLFERGHGRAFKDKMTEVYPGWEKLQEELDRFSIG